MPRMPCMWCSVIAASLARASQSGKRESGWARKRSDRPVGDTVAMPSLAVLGRPASRRWSGRPRHRKRRATLPVVESTAASRPRMPGFSSRTMPRNSGMTSYWPGSTAKAPTTARGLAIALVEDVLERSARVEEAWKPPREPSGSRRVEMSVMPDAISSPESPGRIPSPESRSVQYGCRACEDGVEIHLVSTVAAVLSRSKIGFGR